HPFRGDSFRGSSMEERTHTPARPGPDSGSSHQPTAAGEDTYMRTKRLTLQQRKEIFRALVDTQDQKLMRVSDSRHSIIRQYKITDVQLKQIEEEGSDKDWPPLNEPLQKVG